MLYDCRIWPQASIKAAPHAAPLARRQRPGLCLERPAPGARRAAHRRHADQGDSSPSGPGAAQVRLPRSPIVQLTAPTAPNLGRPSGPLHAIGYADPRPTLGPATAHKGIRRLRGGRGRTRPRLN